ncbi:MAG: type II secretion system F family protein [Cellulomonadaceae bacterium]
MIPVTFVAAGGGAGVGSRVVAEIVAGAGAVLGPVTGLAVTLAVCALVGWPGRRGRRGDWSRAPVSGPAQAPAAEELLTLEQLVIEVSALLRAGASPADAWWRTGRVTADHRGVPEPDSLRERTRNTGRGPGRRGGRQEPRGQGARRGETRRGATRRDLRGRWPRRHPQGTGGAQVAAVVAGCHVAAQVGAPLAPVLDTVARSLVAAQGAADERAAALAGPRTTARLLSWLPVAGLGLGFALGADPVGVLLGGDLGSLLLLGGVGLTAVGRRWTVSLVARARRAEELE